MDIHPPPRPPTGSSTEAQNEEARRRSKQEEFEREEEPAEDLGRMLFKFGRRLFAHQVHVVHRINDARGEMQRRTMVRALGSEERYQFMMERVGRNRLKSREYLTKAAALGLDQLSALLEVQRGLFDGMFDRLSRWGVAEERQSHLIDRMLGLQEEDIHRATVKSIVLFEMVRDLIRDQDELIQKLGADERRQLLEFALGLRKEPPELLARFFQDALQAEPEDRSEFANPSIEKSVQIYPLDLGIIQASSDGKEAHPTQPELPVKTFELTNNSFTDKELAFFIGPCVSVAPQENAYWRSLNLPWPDARLQLAPLTIQTTPDPSNQERPPGTPAGPLLKMLGKVHGFIRLDWHPWFHQHHQFLCAQWAPTLQQLSEEERCLSHELHYRADINVPAVRTILRVSFKVEWT